MGVLHLEMLREPFMQNALLAGSIAAVLAGAVGLFVVQRGSSFAAHALGQIGFAGAAGAVLAGVAPLAGLVAAALAGALALGALGAREHGRDVVTALLLVACLGAGALFLSLNDAYATAAVSLLFGSIVGVDRAQVAATAMLALGCLLALGLLARPLLLDSLSSELAAARGVRTRRVGAGFLVVVALAAAVTIPVVGTLLVFSLMVGPAAAASRLTASPLRALALAVALALGAAWAGMTLAYDTGWPVGFFVSAAAALEYLLARLAALRRRGPAVTPGAARDGRGSGTRRPARRPETA